MSATDRIRKVDIIENITGLVFLWGMLTHKKDTQKYIVMLARYFIIYQVVCTAQVFYKDMKWLLDNFNILSFTLML